MRPQSLYCRKQIYLSNWFVIMKKSESMNTFIYQILPLPLMAMPIFWIRQAQTIKGDKASTVLWAGLKIKILNLLSHRCFLISAYQEHNSPSVYKHIAETSIRFILFHYGSKHKSCHNLHMSLFPAQRLWNAKLWVELVTIFQVRITSVYKWFGL